MLRLLWQYMFGRRRETECASKRGPQDGVTVCPFWKTAINNSKVSDSGGQWGCRQLAGEGRGKGDWLEPEKSLERPSGGENIPMGKCPVCESSVQIYAPCCPKCGTKFFRESAGLT